MAELTTGNLFVHSESLSAASMCKNESLKVSQYCVKTLVNQILLNGQMMFVKVATKSQSFPLERVCEKQDLDK